MSLRAAAYTIAHANGLKKAPMPFTMILACDEQGVIGDADTDGLPWRCKPDLERFKAQTMGNIVVIGAKTFLGLLKTWPGKHVLKGRDVVVVFSCTTNDMGWITDNRDALYATARNAGKQVGERLIAFGVPHVHMRGEAPEYELMECAHELRADIEGFTLPGQHVYIGGGASLNELMLPTCGVIDVTVIQHTSHCGERVYAGPKVQAATSAVRCTTVDTMWDAVDTENGTKCRSHLIPRSKSPYEVVTGWFK